MRQLSRQLFSRLAGFRIQELRESAKMALKSRLSMEVLLLMGFVLFCIAVSEPPQLTLLLAIP